MKSVIWKAVCMLERFRTASLFISLEATLNPVQPGQPYFWDFHPNNNLERAQLLPSSGFAGSAPVSRKVQDDSLLIKISFIIQATPDGT